ncbi:hypothetical protein TNCV_4285671 [Trichonephila clavipes]|nr:hypothetical protein TNCV_4285671 [Trichonephila clavipes]
MGQTLRRERTTPGFRFTLQPMIRRVFVWPEVLVFTRAFKKTDMHCHLSCHRRQRNLEHFTNSELAVHLIYGLSEGNAQAAERLYRESTNMPKMAGEILLARSGRPSDVSDKVLCSMIRTNNMLTSTEVSFKLGIHRTTALNPNSLF